MLVLVILFSTLLLICVAIQTRWANRFVQLYRTADQAIPEAELPHVGVILSLRGADPYLEDCLLGLLSLDYPSHEIRIVVDSEIDPAWSVVKRITESHPNPRVQVELLELRQQTSSLKNSALVQAIEHSSDHCEVFAWLDSDTIPYSGWLRDLVTPLQKPDVGAACGIRWYTPPSNTLGNHVRHIWNSGAVLQMLAFGIGWGGAFAISRSVYVESNLADKWSRALVEDTLASNAVLAGGKRLEFVAAATMPNPESATLSWCISFITRQLQGLRYYHEAWTTVMVFGLISGLSLTATAVLTVLAFVQQKPSAGFVGFSSLFLFGVIVGWLMHRSERQVSRSLCGRCPAPKFSVMLLIAGPVTQLVHLIAVVRTYLIREVTWRGIRYVVRSGMDIDRTNYAPYVAATMDASHSL